MVNVFVVRRVCRESKWLWNLHSSASERCRRDHLTFPPSQCSAAAAFSASTSSAIFQRRPHRHGRVPHQGSRQRLSPYPRAELGSAWSWACVRAPTSWPRKPHWLDAAKHRHTQSTLSLPRSHPWSPWLDGSHLHVQRTGSCRTVLHNC